ncbi:MAG: hypothetical protein ACRC3B_15935 [Bacteroidia bacterium]
MNYKLILILLFAAIRATAATDFDNHYGMGVMHLNFELLTEIKLYTDKNDKVAPAKTITFSVSGKGKSKTAKLETVNTDNWLKPELLKPEKLLFSMRVITRETGWYQLVVNNSIYTTYWVRKIEGLDFYSWSEELLRAASIVRLTRDTNPLRKFQGSSIIIPWDPNYADCFRGVKILGQWMEVETREVCADGTTKVRSAWIQWYDDERLLVDYSLIL